MKIITYTDMDTEPPTEYRVKVRALRIRDSLNIDRDRAAHVEKYAADSAALLRLFHQPLLLHTAVLAEKRQGEGAWSAFTVDEEAYQDLPEPFVLDWLTGIYEVNPQLMAGDLEALKKNLSALLANNPGSINTSAGGVIPTANSTNA